MHHSPHIGYEPAATYALVLAAGAGRRFGGGKLLAELDGAPVLAAALETAWAAPGARVGLVTGCDAPAVAAAATRCARGRNLDFVQAADWDEGISASLRAGIAACPPGAAAALIFLGDMPRVPHRTATQLIAAAGDADAAAPTFEGRRGHPVLLGRRLFARIAQLRGDRGAGALLREPDVRVRELPVDDDGVLLDIDDRAQLAALR